MNINRLSRKIRKRILSILGILIVLSIGFFVSKKINVNPKYEVGQKMDSLNNVVVYYNGGVGNVEGRKLTDAGYNLGLKYQCVEFVKRYYYIALNHKMPDSYGHAKDFFDPDVKDGQKNEQRNLFQYTNHQCRTI